MSLCRFPLFNFIFALPGLPSFPPTIPIPPPFAFTLAFTMPPCPLD